MKSSDIAKYIDIDCDKHIKDLIVKRLSQKTIELSEDYIHAYAEEFVKGYYEGLAGM